MTNTKISNGNNKCCKIINNELFIEDPNSDNNICIASILAINRIDNVHGRIMFLMDSIITIKLINE